jgi:hypothetical protein
MTPPPNDPTSGYRGPNEPGWTGTSPRTMAYRIKKQTAEIFAGTVAHAFQSIVEGSPITGAPGQPVDTGNLRASWQTTFESPTVALISTNVEYAPYVEDNVNNVTFKNHGPHSIKLTVAGLQQVVDAEIVRVTEGRGV